MGLSIFYLPKLNKNKLQFITIYFGIILGLLIISRFELIKYFYLFYPERVAMFCIIPFSIILANLLSQISIKKLKVLLILYIILSGINFHFLLKENFNNYYFQIGSGEISIPNFLFREAFLGNYYLYALSRDQNTLTSADLEAFEWIKENTNPSDLIMNNYYDAGFKSHKSLLI